ncbi:unnamed protein product [Phaedon cochleariae]|uniref:TIL domain-containing protein n=1 Tax=Phaedon cochleariae TaxID=80249 RepID=A0A9P0DRJ4_PHACE|nr:unnamed protein product [Phaedon cochleariae]
MLAKIIIVFTLLCVSVHLIQGALNCPENEFSGCEPCGGQATCQNRNPGEGKACILRCTASCVCNNGFIRRQTSGKCIPINDC